MALKLMYVTNDQKIAEIVDNSGVDWIFLDLEIKGKVDRQGHLNTVISNHKISDIEPLKSVIKKSKLLVRVNPINGDSEEEINEVINLGSDIIMLPYFKTMQEVEYFIKIIDNRAETCLLLETPEAVEDLDSILQVKGIDYVHIGLNDLHLGYNLKFMFELLSNGTVEKIIDTIKKYKLTYGFGGIAKIGQGLLPADKIIAEHYRLNSSMVILSRTFFDYKSVNDYEIAVKLFRDGVKEIREFEDFLSTKTKDYFTENKLDVIKIVNNVLK